MSPRRIGSVLFQALSSAACLIAALGGVRFAPHAGRGAAKYRPAKGCMSRGGASLRGEEGAAPPTFGRRRGRFSPYAGREEAFFFEPSSWSPSCCPRQKAWSSVSPHSCAVFHGGEANRKIDLRGRRGKSPSARPCAACGAYSLPCEKRVIISMVREAESGQGGIWARSTHTASASSAVSRRMSSGPSSSAT